MFFGDGEFILRAYIFRSNGFMYVLSISYMVLSCKFVKTQNMHPALDEKLCAGCIFLRLGLENVYRIFIDTLYLFSSPAGLFDDNHSF